MYILAVRKMDFMLDNTSPKKATERDLTIESILSRIIFLSENARENEK